VIVGIGTLIYLSVTILVYLFSYRFSKRL